MTRVKPFCGTRYNPTKIEDPAEVATWPYDCIDEDDRDQFYKKNEYNVIRLIKAKQSPMDSGTDNPYTRAAADLMHWLESGVLVTDPAPAFYYYRMGYSLPDGSQMLRKGFIGLLRLPEGEQKDILPHEQVDPEPLKDRLHLIKHTGANLSPVFMTYNDPERSVLSLAAGSLPNDPIIKTTFTDGSEHAIWRITDTDICDSISKEMEPREVMIADGHHRFEAALRFRAIGREKFPDAGSEAPFEYVLTYFSPAEDEGITILPTHRAISGLSSFSTDSFMLDMSKKFYIKEVALNPDKPQESLTEALEKADELNQEDETFVMGVAGADSLFLLNFKKDQAKSSFPQDVPDTVRTLDVSILQQVILENILKINGDALEQGVTIDFFHDAREIFQRLSNDGQLVFLMNPTRMETLWTLAREKRLLPTKSTCFFPKVLAGFVFYKF